MIRIASTPAPEPIPAWHDLFESLLPAIRKHARIAFRHLDPESKAEAVQNAICIACSAVARLAELDKLDLCFPSVLARFAVAQTKDGRMLGRPLNCKDISSKYCQRTKNITVERLDKYDREDECWEEVLVPDQTCTPAELAASRIDVPAWFDTLKPRVRRIAKYLAAGQTTTDAARKFKLSAGRVSQLRKELFQNWRRFAGDEPLGGAAMAV